MSRDGLVKRFADAGLTLHLKSQPLRSVGRNGASVFQMDIKRDLASKARKEYFEIFPGAEENTITVLDVDKEYAQLVLVVKEASREIIEEAPSVTVKHQQQRHGDKWLEKMLEESRIKMSNVVSTPQEHARGIVKVKRKTDGNRRHFLLGRDERQMFMCQLSKPVTTVKQAHDSLKSPVVAFAEGKAGGRTQRQGEWFMVNLTAEEMKRVKEALKKKDTVVHKNVAINKFIPRPGKPHMVSELLVLEAPKLEHGYAIRPRPDVFIRGALSHPDHRTQKYAEWRKVLKNREQESVGSIAGGTWVD